MFFMFRFMRQGSTKKVYVKSYGCQMNVYDGAKMHDVLKVWGYDQTSIPDDADLVILNTCHIREKAEHKLFSDLGRVKRVKGQRETQGKETIIAVGGCVGQAEGEEVIERAPYVDIVFGPQTYHRLPEYLAKVQRQRDDSEQQGVVDIEFPIESKFDLLPQATNSPASAFLSIQEGCDKFCTFCVVPYTRGAEYSRPVDKILEEAKHLVNLGALEITLLGQNVNAYHGEGPSKSTWSLGRLIRALSEIQGLERIRYTTSHPRDVNDDLILVHAEIPKLMPYIHLPVQSGSDTILKNMNRKHTRDDYLRIIDRFTSKNPQLAFSSDFIVGYPGETDKDFQDTLDLIQIVKFAQAYSFSYSARLGTPAAAMALQVPEEIKKVRLKHLQGIVNHLQLEFNKKMIGTTQAVLFDKKGRYQDQMIGKTPYMQSVHVMGDSDLDGKLLQVYIEDAQQNSLKGRLISL